MFDHFSILLLNIKISKFFEILWNFWALKNQALCQYIYGSLYHVIQLPVMTSDWKRMNKRVVNNVHLKKTTIKNFNSANAGPKPVCKRSRVMLHACKGLLSLLKAENPMTVSIYAFYIFTSKLQIDSLSWIYINM